MVEVLGLTLCCDTKWAHNQFDPGSPPRPASRQFNYKEIS